MRVGGLDLVVSKDIPRLAVRWGLPWAQLLVPLPWASLCSSGLSKGGQAWGCPPHSTALTPPLPFPQPPPLPVVPVELWEFSAFWLTPAFSPRPFIILSKYLSWQIRAWYWNCHPEDRLLELVGPWTPSSPFPAPHCIYRETKAQREGGSVTREGEAESKQGPGSLRLNPVQGEGTCGHEALSAMGHGESLTSAPWIRRLGGLGFTMQDPGVKMGPGTASARPGP